jgi:hypothetical protein
VLSEMSDENATVGHQKTETPSKSGDSRSHCAVLRSVSVSFRQGSADL